MKRFFKKLFTKNWELKLISLILALILWLILIPEEKIFSEKNLTITLETHNTPQGMELVKKPLDKIDVTIKAPNRYIDQITPTNVVAILNLENASVVQEDYPLNETMISIPAGAKATVIRISPNTVNLKLEKTKQIMLEVEPDFVGEVKEGYKMVWRVVPDQVLIQGPESKLKEDYIVRTSPIDISELTETTTFEVDLILPNPDVRPVSSQAKATVTILIQEEKSEDRKTGNQKIRKNNLSP
ncbi:MAG: YbbR-like domain-containing protein [Candidatus Aminicenantes bacterium]|nr:YbbR-like domain-containing protein [Candidatus Aminicenantes bacterium]